MRSRFLMSLVVATLVSTFAFAFSAGAQETTDASVSATASDSEAEGSEQPLVFAEGEQAAQAQAETQPSGPLAGTRVGTISTDEDAQTEIITIPRPDCTVKEGASFVLQDEDGTQADFIDNENVQITEARDGLKVTSNLADPGADIAPLEVRGGKDSGAPALDTGGLVIVTSTDIECEGDNTPPPGGGPQPSPSPGPSPGPSPDPSPQPEPQDRDKGPLAGGTAFGKDVLVPGDVIDILPDGTKVVGIDQVIIKTKNCKLTAHGDDLTITMSNQGVPFRIRDGQNVDITIKPDGTIVANGRRTLGDEFPAGRRDNPTRVIVPIAVDKEGKEWPSEPNSKFPIISSTGIGGEGCHVVDGADTGNSADNGGMNTGNAGAGNPSSSNDVIPNTTSDKPLPNTGGVPLFGPVVSGLVLAGAGLLLFGRSALQPVSTSARQRSENKGQPPPR